jgi:hypothetical protein
MGAQRGWRGVHTVRGVKFASIPSHGDAKVVKIKDAEE